MLAAVAVEQEGLEALIPETLAEARYLYFIELEDGEVQEALPISGEDGAVQALAARQCRALICGQISPAARQALRQLEVLCFDGYLYQARQVRRLLYTGVLPCV